MEESHQGSDGPRILLAPSVRSGHVPILADLWLAHVRGLRRRRKVCHHAVNSARLQLQGAHAEWHATEESGVGELERPAFYVPLSETPEVEGWIVQAALDNGGSMPLLPAGEARVERVAEVTLATPSARSFGGVAFERLVARAFLHLMNQDGSWFGSLSEWFSVVPEGWSEALPAPPSKPPGPCRSRGHIPRAHHAKHGRPLRCRSRGPQHQPPTYHLALR